MASSSKGVEVRPYLDPLEELHALVDRYDLSRKSKAAVQSPSRPLGLASPEAWMAAAILGPAKEANTSPLPPPPPPPPPPASIFKPLSQSVYAPPHTLPHRDPNRIAASSRPRTDGNKQQQQQQQRWQQQRQPFAPMSMIREEKKWKKPEQAPVAAVVPTSTTIVQKPKQMKQHAPVAVVVPTTINTARTTMVQKPKQTNQQAPVAVVAPTSTTTITTTTTTTMVQKPKQTKQQAPPPPQQHPQRVWNGNGWTEPAGTRDPEDARKEEMRLAFRHILRF